MIRTASSRLPRRSATATDEALLSLLGLPQRLALSYCPARTRDPMLALLALDGRLAELVRKKREPILAQMRIAWWRDTLAKDPSEWPRGDPVLGALTGWDNRAALIGLVNGWERLLGETLDKAAVTEFATARGDAFAALAHRIGEVKAAPLAARAGYVWALGDLAANLGDANERALVVELGQNEPPVARLPRSLRPLTVLAGLARQSLQRGGTSLLEGPASGLLALRLGLTGR